MAYTNLFSSLTDSGKTNVLTLPFLMFFILFFDMKSHSFILEQQTCVLIFTLLYTFLTVLCTFIFKEYGRENQRNHISVNAPLVPFPLVVCTQFSPLLDHQLVWHHPGHRMSDSSTTASPYF